MSNTQGDRKASKQAGSGSALSSYAKWGAASMLVSPWMISLLRSALLEPIHINPPAWLRILLGLVFLANYRSTPFLWHIRVLYPAFKAAYTARAWFPSSSSSSSSSSSKLTSSLIRPQLKLSHIPLGKDVFTDTSTYHFTATFDDCDWNGHLSNSSYSKSLDHTRMYHNSPRILKTFYDGAWPALGGSAFNFHREIPMLAKYDIRMSFEAWDDKWFYVTGRFVSPAKSSKKTSISNANGVPATKDAVTEKLLEGETLYCTSISRYVLKSGRRTIPPWLMMVTSGYGTLPSTRTNWEKAESLREFYLNKEREAYLGKNPGKKTISNKVNKKLTKKAALFRQYRVESERKGTEDEAWMSKSYWSTEEWEQGRREGLERLKTSVGILPVLEK